MADVMSEKDDDKDEEIVIIEEDPAAKKAAEPEDEDHDDEHDDEDERVKSSADEDEDEAEKEREAIRERRRIEKQERKQRRDEAIKRDKIELDFLRKRNDDLERRLTAQEQRSHQTELRGLDAEIARAQQEAEMAEKVIAKAVEAGNGDDVAQAMRYRDAAIQRAQQLAWQKQQAAQPPQQNAIDSVTMSHAQKFLDENPWYDAQGRDEDSAIVMAIDAALAKDGFDPRTERYWDELRKRAERRLPERFAARGERDDRREDRSTQKREERAPRGGPQVGSGKEHAPPSTRKEIYISPERKQALIEAGVWDDPILRNKYVKRYAEYDRQNKA